MLMYSNGYNIPGLFPSASKGFGDIFRVMGIKGLVLSNENIGFVVFIILPGLIGLIGFIITKPSSKV